MAKTILVTGAHGFIGYHLALRLTQLGHRVIACDLPGDPRGTLRELRAADLRSWIWHQDLFDIRDQGSFQRVLTIYKPEIIFHLAALPGVRRSFEDPEAYWSTNVIGSLNLLQASATCGVQKVFLASSSSVYGDIENGEVSDELSRIDRPVSPYAASKSAMELMANTLRESLGIQVLSLRFFTVFGPWGRPDMAAWKFTRALLDGQGIRLNGDGTALRDFTPVGDLVDKLISLTDDWRLNKLLSVNSSINLGSGNPLSVLGFLELLAHELDLPLTVHPGEKAKGDVLQTRSGQRVQEDIGIAHLGSGINKGVQDWIDWAKHNVDLLRRY